MSLKSIFTELVRGDLLDTTLANCAALDELKRIKKKIETKKK
jgi:hypothetical protein